MAKASTASPVAPHAITVDDLLEELPGHIRVGPYDIAIEIWDKFDQVSRGADAEFSGGLERIAIGSVASRMRLADVFIHEVTHAVFWAYDINPSDGEERIVTALGTAWAQIYRDNHWLMDWIRRGVAR
jgi:hypothetical protein